MFGIGFSEILVILIVFVIVIKPTDYREILISLRKIITYCIKIRNQISAEINNISKQTEIKENIDDIINDLADGELIDKDGKKHKYYNLEDFILKKDR